QGGGPATDPSASSRRVAAPDQPGAGQSRQRSQRDACHHAAREAAGERRHGGGGDVAYLCQGGELGQEASLLRVVAAQAAVEAEAEQELADAEQSQQPARRSLFGKAGRAPYRSRSQQAPEPNASAGCRKQ